MHSAPGTEPWASRDTPLLPVARRLLRACLPRNTRFKAYFRMLETPVISDLYVRGRGRLRHRRVRASTRIVIEAFPSSGSTFCRQALLLCNPDLDPAEVCSHTHTPRVVQQAVRLGVPCIVIARDPRDAVASMVQRFTGIHIDSAFDYYSRYYSSLLPVKKSFVVAPFARLTADVSSIVSQCNQQFGVAFVTLADAGVTDDTVLRDIDRREQASSGRALPESMVSRPTSSRRSTKDVLQNLSAVETTAMNRALDVYRQFIDDAPSQPGPTVETAA
ncbi:MAG: hypothetical protein H0U35_00655 [Sporichthyaceae bacterium]|nr:hypothetical protein [Sporichthyaceae bacterium]